MTAPDSKEASIELEECVSQWPGHADRILIQKGVCATQGYRRLRSAGSRSRHSDASAWEAAYWEKCGLRSNGVGGDENAVGLLRKVRSQCSVVRR